MSQGLLNNQVTINDNNVTDVVFLVDALKVPGSGGPDFEQVGTSGVYAYNFAPSQDSTAYFQVQVPHSYQAGSSISIHIHWAPSSTNTGIVNWKITYQLKSIDSAFSASASSDTGTDLYDAGDGTTLKHQMTASHVASGSGVTESAILLGTIARLGSGDSFTGDAWLVGLDAHIYQDKLGTATMPA